MDVSWCIYIELMTDLFSQRFLVYQLPVLYPILMVHTIITAYLLWIIIHFLCLFFSDEEKDVVSVDGTEVYAKSHEEDLTKEGGNGLMPLCVCSLKIHHKSLHKDIQA